jgi:hypothetical protein
MVVNRSEYSLIFVDQIQKTVVADSMLAICQQYEKPLTPISNISIVRANIESVTQDPPQPVHFTVSVTPGPAASALCSGTPNNYTVNDGDEVIFQAIATTGFTFVGWYLGSALLSSSLVAKLPVNAPVIAGQTVQFLATFAAV